MSSLVSLAFCGRAFFIRRDGPQPRHGRPFQQDASILNIHHNVNILSIRQELFALHQVVYLAETMYFNAIPTCANYLDAVSLQGSRCWSVGSLNMYP